MAKFGFQLLLICLVIIHLYIYALSLSFSLFTILLFQKFCPKFPLSISTMKNFRYQKQARNSWWSSEAFPYKCLALFRVSINLMNCLNQSRIKFLLFFCWHLLISFFASYF
ncbi:hypothetical protein Sjap_007901 [Stephania japonica]|uniref:Uncharacterized protein n=1 Tax=Stephania japonica TaxID=461633 RepID=A0AAP0JNL1_9MAGN